MNQVGWTGSIFLALCAAPQAIQSIKQGHSEGLDSSFLTLWTLGEIFTLFAVLKDAPLQYLIYNYGGNLIFLSVIWKYKLFPRKRIK